VTASNTVKRAKRRRRALVIVAASLAVLLIIAELVARMLVGRIAADKIAEALPQGVSAHINATPKGACVLCELATLRLSKLHLSTSDLTVGDVRGEVNADAAGIQLGDPVQIDSLEGEIRLSATEVNRLLQDAAQTAGITINDLKFSNGTLSYGTEIDVFGRQIAVLVDARVRIRAGGYIRIEATDLRFKAGDFSSQIDTQERLVSFDACVAEYIPELLQITNVDVSDAGLTVGVRTRHGFTAAEESFTELGSCRR